MSVSTDLSLNSSVNQLIVGQDNLRDELINLKERLATLEKKYEALAGAAGSSSQPAKPRASRSKTAASTSTAETSAEGGSEKPKRAPAKKTAATEGGEVAKPARANHHIDFRKFYEAEESFRSRAGAIIGDDNLREAIKQADDFAVGKGREVKDADIGAFIFKLYATVKQAYREPIIELVQQFKQQSEQKREILVPEASSSKSSVMDSIESVGTSKVRKTTTRATAKRTVAKDEIEHLDDEDLNGF